MALSPERLEQLLKQQFPVNATSWAQATDEVRSMCRDARIVAGVAEADAVDFNQLDTPSAWNTEGIAGTIRFYSKLSMEQQEKFCATYSHWLTQWQANAGQTPT